ncbi:MAG: radical SAM protein [Syntrophales bacterium]|nr:radical SAM protein [Syntrophales bacterium]MDY0043561.1 radical SAM protein [Syntrophales bacterium]
MTLLAKNKDIGAHVRRLEELKYKVGMYRPPSEGGSFSLLLRFTENCPWNKCTFCSMYKEEKFVYRPVEEIKADIDSVKKIRDEIIEVSWKLGLGGRITRDVAMAILRFSPSLDSNYCFAGVFNWLNSGGKTAFLQDANSIIMRPFELMEALRYLREQLPSLARVTTYARSKTLAQRKPEDLKGIREAGLDRLHVGLETGDDELLKIVRKGVTSEEQIEGGRKAMEAGFQLSEYWMPDLGGRERWRQHAENTARVLTAINPSYIRSRPFVPGQGTAIYNDYKEGKLHISSPHERLEELECMIGLLNVNSKVCFDHMMNSWRDRKGGLLFTQDYEGYKFPEEKEYLLERIREGRSIDESNHFHVEDLMRMGML